MKMLLVFIPGLSLLGYCTILSRYGRFKIETTPFFVVSSIISLLYIAAMFNALQIAANVLLFLGCAALLLSPLYLTHKDSNIFENYLVPGLIVPLGFILIFSLFVCQMHFTIFDEFGHWGLHAKLVYYNNGLITASQNTVHKDYPPASALFYYYFFHLTGYSEGVAFIAQAILLFAPLSILLQGFSWKKITNAITSYVVIYCLLALYLKIFYNFNSPMDILMDSVVGVFLGMGLTYYFQSKRTALNIMYLTPIFFAFMLLKAKLMPLALLALLLIFFDQLLIFCRERSRNIEDYRKLIGMLYKRIFAFVLLVVSFLVAKISWHHYLVSIHVLDEWKLGLSIRKIVDGIFFNIDAKERLVLDSFIKHTVHSLRKLFFILSLIVLAYFFKKRRIEKIEFLFVHVYMFLGFIIYLLGLLVLYSYVFIYYIATISGGFDRYLNIYYISWLLLIFGEFFRIIRVSPFANLRKFQIPFACLTIAIIINWPNSYNYFRAYYRSGKYSHHGRKINLTRQAVEKIANSVKKTIPIDNNIMIVWQNSGGFERKKLIYSLAPWTPYLPYPYSSGSFGSPASSKDVRSKNISLRDFKLLLNHADYLLLAYTDKNFWDHYGALFDYNHHQLRPLTTYKICVAPGYSGIDKPGCVIREKRAYLFKVIKHNNNVLLKNVASEEKENVE